MTRCNRVARVLGPKRCKRNGTIELLRYALGQYNVDLGSLMAGKALRNDVVRAHAAGRPPESQAMALMNNRPFVKEKKITLVEFFGDQTGWLGRVGIKDLEAAVLSGAVELAGPLGWGRGVVVRLVCPGCLAESCTRHWAGPLRAERE